jgi:hypothetical protein
MKLFDTDYVVVNKDTLEPVESLDIIYGEDSMQEVLQHEGLCNSQMFISMTKLPKKTQDKYLESIIKNKEVSNG